MGVAESIEERGLMWRVKRDGGHRALLFGEDEGAVESTGEQGGEDDGPSRFDRVAALAEVGEHDGSQSVMMNVLEQACGVEVGKVPAASGNALLHHGGIATGAEQQFVVIGLEHEAGSLAEEPADGLSRSAEVSRHADGDATRQRHAECHRLGGIV